MFQYEANLFSSGNKGVLQAKMKNGHSEPPCINIKNLFKFGRENGLKNSMKQVAVRH